MGDIPEYAEALEKALGPGSLPGFQAECAKRMNTFNDMAERIYINWLQATART